MQYSANEYWLERQYKFGTVGGVLLKTKAEESFICLSSSFCLFFFFSSSHSSSSYSSLSCSSFFLILFRLSLIPSPFPFSHQSFVSLRSPPFPVVISGSTLTGNCFIGHWWEPEPSICFHLTYPGNGFYSQINPKCWLWSISARLSVQTHRRLSQDPAQLVVSEGSRDGKNYYYAKTVLRTSNNTCSYFFFFLGGGRVARLQHLKYFDSRIRVLPMQKLSFSLLPGVDQNKTLRASSAARNYAFLLSAFSLHSA